MRYTIKRSNGEYLHIGYVCYGERKITPFWTPDQRDSAIFGTKNAAQEYIDKNGITATPVPRTAK